jgi:hypothetical protein
MTSGCFQLKKKKSDDSTGSRSTAGVPKIFPTVTASLG